MASTPNLGLYKPTRDDYINVNRDIAQNMQKIDDAFYGTVDANEFGIVVTGDTANVNVVSGQYVIVRQSTISGVDDGLYVAMTAVPAGEAFTSGNLELVDIGGLNAVKKRPNYESSNKVDIAGGANVGNISFTAPSDGECFLRFGFRTERTVYVIVNEYNVAFASGGRDSLTWYSLQVVLRKGDVLRLDGADSWYAFLCAGSYFIPYND